jgi:hypothetical protein
MAVREPGFPRRVHRGNMDYIDREPATSVKVAKMVAGEWYVRGFADGYHARLAIIPSGSAGEQYNKGYNEGLEAALRDIFSAAWSAIS